MNKSCKFIKKKKNLRSILKGLKHGCKFSGKYLTSFDPMKWNIFQVKRILISKKKR